MDWQELARCREVDPELFYPEKSDHLSGWAAKRICQSCEVKAECLKAGMDDPYGIWGGLSAKERWRIRKGMAA